MLMDLVNDIYDINEMDGWVVPKVDHCCLVNCKVQISGDFC